MSAVSSILRSVEGGRLALWCPGCLSPHMVKVDGALAWGFNGDLEKPTFTPSVLVTYNGADADTVDQDGRQAPPAVCHSFVKDGQIQFLGDCTHPLAGQTVALGPWPENDA